MFSTIPLKGKLHYFIHSSTLIIIAFTLMLNIFMCVCVSPSGDSGTTLDIKIMVYVMKELTI